MDDLKRQWMSDMKMDFEGDVMSLDDGPVGYAPYRMAWNGNQLHPVDCINVLHSLIGHDLNVELSPRSKPHLEYSLTDVFFNIYGV